MKDMLHSLTSALHLHRERRPEDVPAGLEELQTERELTDGALRALTSAEAPERLALQIRLALSHEQVRRERRWTGRLQHRWETFRENALQPFAVQAAVAAVALLSVAGGALMLGAVAPQQAVQANDTPLAGFSAPRYLYSMAGEQPVGSSTDAPLIVEAKVDPAGRVYDYRVVSGGLDATASSALQQRLLTGVFQPARVFGEPVRGTVLLTFADVVVRG